METTPEQLAARLGKGPLAPAYLIAGPEALRVLEGADAVRAAARAQGIGEREVFQAEGNQREPDWAAMKASLQAPSLFSARRLLELRLPTGKPGTEGGKLLLEFCADPPADVCLLVTCGEWSRSHGGKWSEAIARIGTVAVGWQVKPHELPDWIARRLRARGLQAEPAADATARRARRRQPARRPRRKSTSWPCSPTAGRWMPNACRHWSPTPRASTSSACGKRRSMASRCRSRASCAACARRVRRCRRCWGMSAPRSSAARRCRGCTRVAATSTPSSARNACGMRGRRRGCAR